MDRPREPNIAHPLTSINWRKTSPLPANKAVIGPRQQSVVIGQEVFVEGWVLGASSAPVLVYDITRDSWDIHSWPPTRYAALTTYLSKLVLIGGEEIATDVITNRVLVWQNGDWHPSLCPTSVARCRASAVSSGKFILLAGGVVTSPSQPSTDIVEVFDGYCWKVAEFLPKPCWSMRSVLHKDEWYLCGGVQQDCEVFRATVQSIVHPSQRPTQISVWTRLSSAPDPYCSITAFGQQLLTIGGKRTSTTPINAYIPHTQSWLHVEDLAAPTTFFHCALTLPNGDLMVVTENEGWIGQLKVLSYHPESRFNISAIERLSIAIGVDMWQEIGKYYQQYFAATKIEMSSLSPNSKELVCDWLDGKSSFTPSWFNLLAPMRTTSLRKLSFAIEHFLYTVPPTAALPLEGAGEGRGTGIGTQSREQGVQTEENGAVKSELEGGGAVEMKKLRSEAVEHHMTAGDGQVKKGVKKEVQTEAKTETADQNINGEAVMLKKHSKREPQQEKEEEVEEMDRWGTDEEDEEGESARSKELSMEEEWKLQHTNQKKKICKTNLVPIRGADIIATTSLKIVPGTPLTFTWEGHGLKLHIPEGALKLNTPTLTMSIQASLSGHFQLPDDTELVSGVYWVACPQRFFQPVTLELQHCACLEHPDQLFSLFFLTAKGNCETLPYQFKPLPGGVFSTGNSYGAIELNHFCGVGVGRRKKIRKGKVKENSKNEREEKRYSAHTFYIPQAATTWVMHFTIVCDLELCLKKVKSFYMREKRAEAGPYLEIMFDGDEVSLDIPEDGITLPSGWTLLPLVYPTKLLRKSVDNYQPGHTIPSCQVELDWVKEEEHPKKLSHKLRITGVRPSNAYIRISRNPILPASESSSSVEVRREDTEGASSSGSWSSQSHSGEKRRLERENTSQPVKRKKLDASATSLVGLLVKTFYSTSVPSKWKLLGVILNLQKGALDNIESQHRQNPQHCLMEMLELWQTTVDPTSLDDMIEALQVLEEDQVALELRKVCQQQPI